MLTFPDVSFIAGIGVCRVYLEASRKRHCSVAPSVCSSLAEPGTLLLKVFDTYNTGIFCGLLRDVGWSLLLNPKVKKYILELQCLGIFKYPRDWCCNAHIFNGAYFWEVGWEIHNVKL